MKLMVLDGNSIINRAFYGIRALSTRDGLPTNAVYGFITTLQRLLDEEEPEGLCVTFDRREPTFRHKADTAYKATRHGMPEELAVQMPVLKEVLSAMAIPYYELSGYEADDLIGTISRKCEASGWDCVIVTGDKDSLQLITDHTRVKLVSTRMGQTITKNMTPEVFLNEYGFAPVHMVDLKALMGDSSDNIPGVPGCGEKTAMGLIQEYGSIDALYDAMPEVNVKPAMLKKLQEGESSARHSHFLATIVTDAPIEFTLENNLRQPYTPALYDLFLRLEFVKLIDKYNLRPATPEVNEFEGAVTHMVTLTTDKEAETYLARWNDTTVYFLPDLSAVAVDDGIDMVQVFSAKYEGNYRAFLQRLCSENIRKNTHDLKHLMRKLKGYGVAPKGFVFDTALAGYLLDATSGDYSVSKLFVSYYNEKLPNPVHLEEDAFSLLGDFHVAEASFASYCTAIAALREYQEPKLAENRQEFLLYEMELPLCEVLADMEIAGMKCDGRALANFGEWLRGEIVSLEHRIYEAAGMEFNINSPKQLGTVLFEQLKLPHGKKTKSGWSTNAEVLEKLRSESAVVADVLTYRQYAKLKSTYADGLGKLIDPDGRIRTDFQMTTTATGRLSSTEPNLQNIPTRTELGSHIRRLFTAESGCVLVDADYSQIELRLLAHMSGDESMIAAFQSGEDFHTVTAAKVFHIDETEVTAELRRRAKAVNFGIVYGISAFSLSQDIGVTVAEAKDYMERYFTTYPALKQYMNDVVEEGREWGYVETMYHRRRALPELKASNFAVRAFGERVALNMPVQGAAADVIKLAMVAVHHRLREEKLKAKLIMQVHDELIVECPTEERERVETLLAEEMERVGQFRVPLIAEAHSGTNWLEAKKG